MLVERNNRQAAMIEVGKAVSRRARDILAGVQDIKSVAQTSHSPIVGEMRVGIIPTKAPYLLPNIMPN